MADDERVLEWTRAAAKRSRRVTSVCSGAFVLGETGMTPAAYVESPRIEQARIALEGSDAQVESIARHCGFGTVETMRRAFHRRLGVGPTAYRSRFRPSLEGAE